MDSKVAGKLGLARESHMPSVEIDKHRMAKAAISLIAPTEDDWSGGIPGKILGMLGNADWSDCGPAGTEHGRMFKAILAVESGVPQWAAGFRAPHEPYTMWLYAQYLKTMGETLAQDPGVENSSWLLFMYNITKTNPGDDTLAFAEWSLTTDPNQLLLDATALRGMLTAVELDTDYNKEFNNDEPFGTLSIVPNPNYGHDMWWSGFGPTYKTYCTWSTYHEATLPWDAACVIERWGILTKEDAERTGVNWDSLTASLDAETDAHPALSGVDFSQFSRESYLQRLETHMSELWKHL